MARSDTLITDIPRRIEKQLGVLFQRYEKTLGKRHPIAKKMIRQIGEFTMRRGAKRIRGTLVVLGYLNNPRKRIDENILTVAAAYETLHSYLLIHDDIIDEDTTRRGKPTMHHVSQRLAPAGVSRAQKEKIGRDIAIIAGDVAADLVQRMVLDTSFSDAKQKKILELIEETLHTTYAGQILDILAVPENPPPLADQRLRYELKTAVYSIEAPFALGLELSRTQVRRDALRTFAQHAGVGFQLADDIENTFGSSTAARTSDIQGGKVTYLISLALQAPQYRKKILQILRREKKGTKDLGQLRKLITESGGHDRALDIVAEHYRRAGILLPRIGLHERVAAVLQQLLHGFQSAIDKK